MLGGIVVGAGALMGLMVGSFLNVVAYRVPRGLSVVHPGSACPECGMQIRAIDNVPVLSWLLLRGRCRQCATPISMRYPAVELATALALAGVAWWWVTIAGLPDAATVLAWSLGLTAFMTLAVASVVLALIDLAEHRLPNAIVYPTTAIVLSLLAATALVTNQPERLLQLAIGGLGLGALYLVIVLVAPRGMGMGDLKLSVVLGGAAAWVSYPALIVAGFAPFLLGGLFAVALLAFRRVARRTRIPFGPWMLVGAWIGIVAGDTLTTNYLAVWGL